MNIISNCISGSILFIFFLYCDPYHAYSLLLGAKFTSIVFVGDVWVSFRVFDVVHDFLVIKYSGIKR
jgi:hypothetical protein